MNVRVRTLGLAAVLAAVFVGGCDNHDAATEKPPLIPAVTAHETRSIAAATQPAACCDPAAPSATAPAAPTRPPGAQASAWIEPAARRAYDLDVNVTDQDGQMMKLRQLTGTPMAISFIFTRCTNAQMCPLTTANMATLQKEVEAAGLSSKVRLLLITYDPDFDTPRRLKKYGQQYGLNFDNASLLRPARDDFRKLFLELQVTPKPEPDGSITHTLELLVLDKQGRFVRDYQGGMWKSAAVLEDLKKLAAEPG